MAGPNYLLLLRPLSRAAISSTVPHLATSTRAISTSQTTYGRRNFRKFPILNKRGIFEHKKLPKQIMETEYKDRVVAIDDLRIRYPGVWFGKKFVYVREMEPELVVAPDFENSPLKPYVSYKTEEIYQSEFTAEQLFNATYGQDIVHKVKNNELIPESLIKFDENAAAEAKNRALKTGADIFSHTSYFGSLDEEWRFGH